MAIEDFSASACHSPDHNIDSDHRSEPLALRSDGPQLSFSSCASDSSRGIFQGQSIYQPFGHQFGTYPESQSAHLPTAFPAYNYSHLANGINCPVQMLPDMTVHSQYQIQNCLPNSLGTTESLRDTSSYYSNPQRFTPEASPFMPMQAQHPHGIYTAYEDPTFGYSATTAASSSNYSPEPKFSGLEVPFSSGTPNNGPWCSMQQQQQNEPYATLIYKALLSAPGHRMVLKEIYEWFEKNTDKGKDPKLGKGWQNSIRHNLSMNGVSKFSDFAEYFYLHTLKAFRKEEQNSSAEDSKRNYVWVLEPEAIKAGYVESTTRYRNPTKSKKGDITYQRPLSGSKISRSSRGRLGRHRKSIGHYPQHIDHTSINPKDGSAEVKFEADDTNTLSPLPSPDSIHTNFQYLSTKPAMTSADMVCRSGSTSLVPKSDPSISQHCSPTPTMTTGSYTDLEPYEFEQVTACTEDVGWEPLFLNGAKETPNEVHEGLFHRDWDRYMTIQQQDNINSTLNNLRQPGA
jgi:hypothetical protein